MNDVNKTILITGAAGFIGFSLIEKLKNTEFKIICIDNINDYYDVNLKYRRLANLGFLQNLIEEGEIVHSISHQNLSFIKVNLEDKLLLEKIMIEAEVSIVVNLAAQAGVRYSIENPSAYVSSNIVGFVNLLEISQKMKIKHFIYASSSSVYGIDSQVPFSESHHVDHPISMYAATKKSNELMAYVYSHLYGIHTIGLRFFTVYGPWGRPDMAPMLFAKAIFNNKPINVFNNGNLRRDFTFIDDIVNGIIKIIDSSSIKLTNIRNNTSATENSEIKVPHSIYNIGNSSPVNLMYFISLLEKQLNKKAEINYLPMQSGDVYDTFADISSINKDFGYTSSFSIEEGTKIFVDWFLEYYKY